MGQEPDFELTLFAEGHQIGSIKVRREYVQGRPAGFAVALVAFEGGQERNVRLYDNAHGHAEMHRYTGDGTKLEGHPFQVSDQDKAVDEAIDQVVNNFEEIINSWLQL